ncbi:MAG TPA: hypothetical protein VJM51_08340 [Dehalococcoidia bacterium]|nr:hypothetical protein [Dehalococcoidia bacterium]
MSTLIDFINLVLELRQTILAKEQEIQQLKQQLQEAERKPNERL